MEIRAYESDDLDALLKLFYDTIHSVNLGDYTLKQVNAWADGHPDRAAWARSLEEHFTLVALEGGAIAGFGDIDETGYLDRLYVHKDFQRRGVATALCDRLEAHVQGRAVSVHASITAQPFFSRRGYRLLRAQTVWRKGVPLVNFVMEKPPAVARHTYLLESGRWLATGNYFDAAGNCFPLRGETRVAKSAQTWRLNGFLEVCAGEPQRFYNDYEIAAGDRPDVLAWTSLNPALGVLRGAFEIAGAAIFSHYASENGAYSGQETLLFRDAQTYENAGIAFCDGKRLSAWTALLRAVRESQ